MFFRNLTLFRFSSSVARSLKDLDTALTSHALRACGPLEVATHGFVSPFGPDFDALSHTIGKATLVTLGSEEKLLPASVIADAATAHAAEWERNRGMKPGRRLIREFRDRVTTELLPRAFVRRRRLHAWIDVAASRIVVDSVSPTRAETLTEALRDALGSLEPTLPQPAHAPADTMTGWLRANAAPDRFALGEECELSGNDASRPQVRYLRHPLLADQLRRHLDAGFRVTRLALTWNERLSLVVDEKLNLRRLRFLDMAEARDETAELSPEQRFEAEFALMTGDYSRMLDELLAAFVVPAGD